VRVPSTPLISVLLPVRNAGRYLAAALESLVAQTLDDFECLVVEDGSTDASREIATAYSRRDHRLHVLPMNRHVGVVAALNAAMAAARGPYLARMDADDVAFPMRFALQVAVLEGAPELAVVGSRVAHCTDGHRPGGLGKYIAWQNSLLDPDQIRRDLFVESPLVHPTVLMHRADVVAAGGYHDRGWPEDYDLWMRVLMRGREAAKLPEVLLMWRDHGARLSRTAPAYRLENFRRLKWHYLERNWLRAGETVQVCGAGPTGRWWARELLRAGFGVSAIIDIDPRRVGRRWSGVPVVDYRGLRPDGGRVLAAVASWEAREDIRAHLGAAGLVEGRDFMAVA
jgi:glycosyltransferase involved in cell wall biosynthesis